MANKASGPLVGEERVPAKAKVLVAAVFALFALQIPSPLRLNTDSVDVLTLASNLADGKPYLLSGARPLYPVGVPFIFSLMERAGFASSVGFGLLNLGLLSAAAGAFWVICGTMRMNPWEKMALLLVGFVNFPLIKHAMIPLTDIPYFAVSMAGCAVLEVLPERRPGSRAGILAAGVLLTGAALLTRRNGFVLAVSMLYAVWLMLRGPAPPGSARPFRGTLLACFAGILAVGAILGAALWKRILYVPDFPRGGAITERVMNLVEYRLMDLGTLVFNAPACRSAPLVPLVLASGVILLVLVFVGLARVRGAFRPIHVFLVGNMAILAIWPYGDPRFWIPVIPILGIVVRGALEPWLARRPIAVAARAYLALYAVAALASFAYSTRITYSGARFPELYGSGSMLDAYSQAWWGNQPASDQRVVIIRRYGERGAPPKPNP